VYKKAKKTEYDDSRKPAKSTSELCKKEKPVPSQIDHENHFQHNM